jgi:oxygen-independent coproporphyrinogen-3 oxidase
MIFKASLFEKYNTPTPRYTSYPPANYFKKLKNYSDVIKAITHSNNENPQNISIYIHIPFCGQLCLYCGCNTKITNNKEVMKAYVDTLLKEIDLLKPLLNSDRKISQIHWGGGTPNYLPIEDIQRIMKRLRAHFDFIQTPEIAMECHPAHLTKKYTDELVKLGFNRLSFGIQDFSDKVLDTVHREKPLLPIEEIVAHIKSYKNLSLNLDFIYGLPYQTLNAYKETMQKAVALSPDRLAVFSYAHVPWIKKQQKSLEKYGLPTAEEKIELFQTAYNILSDNEYSAIGLDHFAKPDDELQIALKEKQLHRNFQGYCTLETTGQVYALGVSGISQTASAYLQNTKDINIYTKAINKGKFPVEKIYFVSDAEKIIRHIIEEIMCNMGVSLPDVAKQHQISLDEVYRITQVDFDSLANFEKEGFLSFKNDVLSLTATGQFFMRNIAATFDPTMKNNTKNFSKAL